MDYLKGIKVQYTHPAVPPSDVNVGWIYTVGINKKGLYIDDGNLEILITENQLKCLFTPIDSSWREIELMYEKEIKEKDKKIK